MALLKITDADIQKLKALEAGWYGATITKVSDPTPSKDKLSNNIIITFTIDDADGKEVQHYFNSKLFAMIVPLVEAVRGAKMGAGFDLDTDELKDKKVDIKLVQELYQGNLQNKIDAYLPYGQGKNQKTPF